MINNKTELPDKWVDEGAAMFPISGATKIYQSPGNGVWGLYQGTGPDKRIGLTKLGDKFEFPFKIYDLGVDNFLETVKKTWESDMFIDSKKNLGIIFLGTRGTGKTLAAKILCNQIGTPVIVISDIKEGMVEFIQGLCFEAIILIDEAEKIFKKNEDDEILLRIVDGSYNKTRKMYIMTVNRLDVNENLIGRPGRVRYIKQFGNLTEKAINDYIDDNLMVPEERGNILSLIDQLEISTIDILKNIVEEVNIHGSISENTALNVPKAKYIFDILRFSNKTEDEVKEIKEIFRGIQNIETWLKEDHLEPGETKTSDTQNNEDWLYDKYSGWKEKLTSQFSTIWRGTDTNMGEVIDNVDDLGFFTIKSNWGDEYLCKIIRQRSNPSLYRGGLVY